MEFLDLRSFEDGGVGVDLKSPRFGGFDGADGFVEDACPIDAFVVPVPHSIEMDHEGEVGGWREFVEAFFEEEAVGAEVDVFFAIDQSLDDFADLGMEEGFATGDGDDGGTAFIDGFEAVFGAEVLF